MTTILIILLLIVDVVLLGVLYFIGKRRINPVEVISELNEERRLLKEMRENIREEMEIALNKSMAHVDKMHTVATEVEMEVRTGSETLKSELETLIKEMAIRVDEPMKELTRRKTSLQAVLRKVDKEKQLLLKALERGEKLVGFFGKETSYEEIIRDIQDKKYEDARHLLAKGMATAKVAMETGLPEHEIRMIATVG